MEYAQAIFKNTPYTLEFRAYPWSRAIKNASTGDTLALLGPAKEEAPLLIFPPSEIGHQRFCFYTRTDDPWMYDKPSSVVGRSFILLADTFPDVLKPYEKKAYFNYIQNSETSTEQAINLLKFRRTDTIMRTYNNMVMYLNKDIVLKKSIKFSNCVSKQNLYLAFTPINERSELVMKLIKIHEENIAKLQKHNFLEKLLVKYNIN